MTLKQNQTPYLLAALLIAALLSFQGLTNHLFWEDEADTAIFARNIAATGKVTAWGDQNLYAYRSGLLLDKEMINVQSPSLQYYITAAMFMLFGESEFAARIPFLTAGLLTLLLLSLFVKNFMGRDFPWALPPLVLALSPVFLLYIRNSRYYALSMLFSTIVLVIFTSDLKTARSTVIAFLSAALSTFLLFHSHYFNAVTLAATLPIFFFFKEYRSKKRFSLLLFIYIVTLICSVHKYLALSSSNKIPDTLDPLNVISRFFTLMWWCLRDMALFEYIPVIIIPFLLLPFLIKKIKPYKAHAFKAVFLLCLILMITAATVLILPQSISKTSNISIRYLTPLIPLVAIITAVILLLLWKFNRPLAVIIALLVFFTNTLNLGFLYGNFAFRTSLRPKRVTCTLCKLIKENTNNYTTTTEVLAERLKKLPSDSVVYIAPDNMRHQLIYYLPHLRYCCQLEENKLNSSWPDKELPDFLYYDKGMREMDYVLFRGREVDPEGVLYMTKNGKRESMGQYRLIEHIDQFHYDQSRPEIPYHAFSPKDFNQSSRLRGFNLVKMVQGK